MEFHTRVQGIPCICRVLGYTKPDHYVSSHQIDPPQPEEFEFEILDRHGRPAQWLERKITSDDESELLSQFKERQE